jgi:hypothetical protein
MALTAQQVYNQSLGLQRNRTSQMYGRNLEMLAKQMRDASENLEANLEGRGVLRSGEANTARFRLKEQEAAQRRYLTEDRDYSLQQLNLDEQARKASQGGGSNPSMTPTGGRTWDEILAELLSKSGTNTGSTPPNGGRPVGQMAVEIQRPRGTVDTTVRRRLPTGVRLG